MMGQHQCRLRAIFIYTGIADDTISFGLGRSWAWGEAGLKMWNLLVE